MMYLNGTSMAAPTVAGAAALMLQANPTLTPNLVKALLMYTAQQLPGANLLEQLESCHRRHVPVGDHEPVFLFLELAQSLRAVLGFIDIVEADLLQEVADDAQHRLIIIDDEHRKRRIQCHDVSARKLRKDM